MHRAVPIGVVLAALPCANIAAQQMDMEMHMHGAPAVAGEAKLDVVQDGSDVVLTLGPVQLAAPGTGAMMRLVPAHFATLPRGGTIRGFDVTLVDAFNRTVDKKYLHHVNLILPDRRELFMPVMQRLAASGAETSPIALPWPIGVRVDAGERLMVTSMLHNPGNGPREVFVRARLHLNPAHAPSRIGVQPFFMDIQPPPATASFDLPPGRSTRTWQGSPAVDVRLLGIGGHMHAYAQGITLEDLTTGTRIVELKPRLDKSGDVADVPRKMFVRRLGLPMQHDHVYRLSVVYVNPTSNTIPEGGMAEIGGVVYTREAWPAANTKDASYVADLALQTKKPTPEGSASMMKMNMTPAMQMHSHAVGH